MSAYQAAYHRELELTKKLEARIVKLQEIATTYEAEITRLKKKARIVELREIAATYEEKKEITNASTGQADQCEESRSTRYSSS